MIYKLNTAPATDAVSLTEAKAHLVVSSSTDDTLISSMIKAAQQIAENYLNRQLVTATWELYLDFFPDEITINKNPVASITSITYSDDVNETQTLSSDIYDTDVISYPARISPKYGKSWPSTYQKPNAVKVLFVAGYGAATAVPDAIKHAILLIVGHLYENRGDEGHRTISKTVYNLLDPYTVKLF